MQLKFSPDKILNNLQGLSRWSPEAFEKPKSLVFALILLAFSFSTNPSPAASPTFCSGFFESVSNHSIPFAPVDNSRVPSEKLKAPLNDVGSFRGVTEFGHFFSARFLHHIFHGEYKHSDQMIPGQNLPGIDGGMHTIDALNYFLKLRPDIQDLMNRMPQRKLQFKNGVTVVYLPSMAFADPHNHARRNIRVKGVITPVSLKVLFPRTWSQEKIIEAISSVAVSGSVFPNNRGDNSVIEKRGMFEGVLLIVKIKAMTPNPAIISAYPSDAQPEAQPDGH